MDINEFQRQALETAIYPGKGTTMGLAYAALGLGEAGEVQGKVKKVLRDKGGVLDEETRLAVAKELGDVLWYCAAVAQEIGVGLDYVAKGNLKKLRDRHERGVLMGNGDDR